MSIKNNFIIYSMMALSAGGYENNRVSSIQSKSNFVGVKRKKKKKSHKKKRV